MLDLNLEKVDLSRIKAIAHDGSALRVLIERDGSYRIETLPAPEQAFQGLLQLARFTLLTQQLDDRAAVRKRLLDEIKMVPVDSSSAAAIGYSDACTTLQVNFLSGSRYRYFEVPSQVFQGFLKAPSKGLYLNTVIKAEGYEYKQIR